MKIKSLIYCLLALFLCSCATHFELSERNFSVLYQPGSQFTEPECIINHIDDSTSILYIKLYYKDFLYTDVTNTGHRQANIQLSAYLLDNYESKTLLDSAGLTITDSANYGQETFTVQNLTIHNKHIEEGIIRLSVTDKNRLENSVKIVPFSKENLKGQQSFLMMDRQNQIIFGNSVEKQDSVKLYYPQLKQGKIFVSFYQRKFPAAVPPFSADQDLVFNYKAENLMEFPVEDYYTPYINMPDKGFYFFQCDTTERKGFTVFRFEPGFPMLNTIEQMLDPMRYITTFREYFTLENSEDTKVAVDSFWLEKTGNIDRARSQISKYYNRVQQANRLFTSYLEGWKTDRGMIYIIFGPPNNVYRQTNTELWVYGEAGHTRSVRFSFVKVNNPFTDNDFSLYRNPMFKEAWYNAVENWRR